MVNQRAEKINTTENFILSTYEPITSAGVIMQKSSETLQIKVQE